MVKRIFELITNREKLKKIMDWLAYGSLIMDICITIITVSSLYYPSNLEQYLARVNVILSAIVILSIASALMMVGSKIYEQLLFRTFKIRIRVRNHIGNIRNRIRNRSY